MPNVKLRPVADADHAAWLSLWLGYQRFYDTEIAANISEATWLRFLSPDEPMHAVLAWQGEQPVGLVHFIYHRSCWTTGDYCYLQDLFVDATLRGAGVGRALIEHVYADARAAGASRVHWLTQEHNTTAIHLYERIAERSGFVQYRQKL